MITTKAPSTWQDLQNEVARILSECGFDVATEKTLTTVRGEVEVDVVAKEKVRGREYVILCECKHWKKAIPQAVIHAFRTVVADSGANKGYIIGTKGFQRGSFGAADLTNIELVTWEEFQNTFELSWLIQCFSPLLLKRLSGLMTLAEGFAPVWFPELPRSVQKRYVALQRKHEELGWLLQHLAMHPHMRRLEPYPRLPLAKTLSGRYNMRNVPNSIKHGLGYREVLEAALEYGGRVLAELQAIRDRNVSRKT